MLHIARYATPALTIIASQMSLLTGGAGSICLLLLGRLLLALLAGSIAAPAPSACAIVVVVALIVCRLAIVC